MRRESNLARLNMLINHRQEDRDLKVGESRFSIHYH